STPRGCSARGWTRARRCASYGAWDRLNRVCVRFGPRVRRGRALRALTLSVPVGNGLPYLSRPRQPASSPLPCAVQDPALSEDQRHADATLTGVVVGRSFAADDPDFLLFLHAVADADETKALHMLERLLLRKPNLLAHPYVWDIFRHLYGVFSPVDPTCPVGPGGGLAPLVRGLPPQGAPGGDTAPVQ